MLHGWRHAYTEWQPQAATRSTQAVCEKGLCSRSKMHLAHFPTSNITAIRAGVRMGSSAYAEAEPTAGKPSLSAAVKPPVSAELVALHQSCVQQASTSSTFIDLSVKAKGSSTPWHTAVVRPVLLKGKRHLQVSTYTERQHFTVNHLPGAEAEAALLALLQAPGVSGVTLRTQEQVTSAQVTKKGKPIVHKTAVAPRELVSVSLSHDRTKDTPIPSSLRHPLLHKIGLQTEDGRIRAHMQEKFTQINEFLKLLAHTNALTALSGARTGPLHIVDCGCGASHLTLGTYHYLNNVLGIPAQLSGVDTNAELMARSNAHCEELGIKGARFHAAPIGHHVPDPAPDIVLALHACDTATDDALALAVRHGAPLIMAVPCCHKDLQRALAGRPATSWPLLAALLGHPILRVRALDMATDALRAALLRVAGYKTDIVEFVSAEHTPRNLLIRAVKLGAGKLAVSSKGEAREDDADAALGGGSDSSSSSGMRLSGDQRAAVAEYLALRDYLGATPRLQVLLADVVEPLLRAAAEETQES